MNCSPNENVGTRSTPNLRASLMNPLRRFSTSLISFRCPSNASRAPPTIRIETCPLGLLKKDLQFGK